MALLEILLMAVAGAVIGAVVGFLRGGWARRERHAD